MKMTKKKKKRVKTQRQLQTSNCCQTCSSHRAQSQFLRASPAMEATMAAATAPSSTSWTLTAQNRTLRYNQPSSSTFWGTAVAACGQVHGCRARGQQQAHNRVGVARAYLERNSNPIGDFFGRLQGGLPIVGLLSRIMSDEGGVGADRLQPVEFCRKVEKNCSYEASRAFYEFQERHGPVAKPQYVLLWCWASALGAGLLKSDDLLMSAARLRVSYDIQYETENLELLMDEAAKKRSKSKSPAINVPMEARAEKALDAIMKCCVGASYLEEEDVSHLILILGSVFPTADKLELERIVKSRLLSTDDDDVSGLEEDTEELSNGEEGIEEEVVDNMANTLAQ